MVTKVTLRQKTISKGRKSLYLDFYPPIPHPKTGQPTRREFLKLYVFAKARNPIDKEHNKDTFLLAEQIRQKRENQLNKPEIYNEFEKEQLKAKELSHRNFVEYFRKLANRRRASNHDNWISTLHYLEDFTDGVLRFGDLNETICNDFKEHLLTAKSKRSAKVGLARNTAVSYFNKFKAALRQAYSEGMLNFDLNSKVKAIKAAETKREYLTIDELNSLVRTPCRDELLKRASLFSALTGLRFSDIQKLIWGELQRTDDNAYVIRFRQKKTRGTETHPISEQAYKLLGEMGNPNEKVFPGLKYSAYHNKHLFQWIGAAGITKDITFHCFRHTYAVLQLVNGTDIYTLSKMLGHRELKTTQLYAKIVDTAKREAADRIRIDL